MQTATVYMRQSWGGYIDLGIHDFAEGMSQGNAITECFTDLEQWRLCLMMLG